MVLTAWRAGARAGTSGGRSWNSAITSTAMYIAAGLLEQFIQSIYTVYIYAVIFRGVYKTQLADRAPVQEACVGPFSKCTTITEMTRGPWPVKSPAKSQCVNKRGLSACTNLLFPAALAFHTADAGLWRFTQACTSMHVGVWVTFACMALLCWRALVIMLASRVLHTVGCSVRIDCPFGVPGLALCLECSTGGCFVMSVRY